MYFMISTLTEDQGIPITTGTPVAPAFLLDRHTMTGIETGTEIGMIIMVEDQDIMTVHKTELITIHRGQVQCKWELLLQVRVEALRNWVVPV